MAKIKLIRKENRPIKMIVIDYDNTLRMDDNLFKYLANFKDINEYELKLKNLLQKMINNNVLIVINTGRSFNSFRKSNVFPYNYLCCNNGCEIYDSDDNLLEYCSIEKNDIDKIELFDFPNECEIKKYYPKSINDTYSLTAVSIKNNNISKFQKIIEYFSKNLLLTKTYYDYPKIRLVNAKTNKFKILSFFFNNLHINIGEMRAIGDDDNDYELLKGLKSASLAWQSKKIKKLKLKVYNSVFDYLIGLDRRYEE